SRAGNGGSSCTNDVATCRASGSPRSPPRRTCPSRASGGERRGGARARARLGLLAQLGLARAARRRAADPAALAVASAPGSALAGGGTHGSTGSNAGVLAWLGVSAVLALAVVPVNLGLAAGALYGAGDVATKAAVHHPAFVPLVLVSHGAAFVALQLGFQRGS